MKVSVLMPCYNAGKYLQKAVESVRASTEQDFEIIILDDGSTDNTAEIALDLKAKDDRIRLISREEKGFAFTFNELLDNAKGEYVLNVDPDDWIEPTMIETMLNKMDDNTDFVKCGFWFEYEDGNIEYLYDAPYDEFCPRYLPPDKKMFFFVSQVAMWTCLVRRSFIEKHHIRLNETEGAAYQDTGFIWQINTLAEKVKVVNKPLYHYNKMNANASTASSRYPMAPSVEYNRIAKWLVDNPEYGIQVRPVLCRARFGSYMWNMSRIDKKDRLSFAVQTQYDFNDDWNYLDVRMFHNLEYTAFRVGMQSPEDFVRMFDVGVEDEQ